MACVEYLCKVIFSIERRGIFIYGIHNYTSRSNMRALGQGSTQSIKEQLLAKSITFQHFRNGQAAKQRGGDHRVLRAGTPQSKFVRSCLPLSSGSIVRGENL